MERANIIILKKDDTYETWGSLTTLCAEHGLSYNYLKSKKFPFEYKGLTFIKTPFKTKQIVV